MTGEARVNNTHDLLTGLLGKESTKSPLLLILEDAHWQDSASWALTRLVHRNVKPLLIVIATRPLTDPRPDEYSQLIQASNTQQMRLDVLPPEDTLELVCGRLGVGELPEAVGALIQEKGEGHPFFSEELAYALRDAGLILIDNGECRIAPEAGNLRDLNFPDTLQGVITSRIDRLTAPQQLALKVASVIGRVFAFHILRDVHPIGGDKPQLSHYLNTLERLEFTSLETPEPDLAYIFKHIITQDVVYNLMAFAQRQQLHRAIAVWYEGVYTDDISPFYPLLAYHWSRALGEQDFEPEIASKAIDYLEKAGEQAMESYANQEAVGFYSEALALDARLEPGSNRLRRGRWERGLGEAYYRLTQFTEAEEHLEKALVLLGRPLPSAPVRLVISLVGGLLEQALHRLWPSLFIGRSQGEERARFLESYLAYEHLADIYNYSQRNRLLIIGYGNAFFQMHNLAERAGPSPHLARSNSNMYLIMGNIGLHSLAEAYHNRAEETVKSVNDLPAMLRMRIANGIYRTGIGQWAKAQGSFRQAIEISDRLGDRFQWGQAIGILEKNIYFQGEFAHALKMSDDLYEAVRHGDNLLIQGWGLYSQGENKLRLGKIDEAISFIEAALAIYTQSPDRQIEPLIYGLLAVARLHKGEHGLARSAAHKAAELIAELSFPFFFLLEGYAGVAEVYLALWEASSNRPVAERKTLEKSARQACKALHKFARVFPIGRTRAWLWKGLYFWLAGKGSKAMGAWQKGLAAARKLEMPYDEGLLHYEIGRHLDAPDPARKEHLARACEIFERLGASYDLERAQARLETP